MKTMKYKALLVAMSTIALTASECNHYHYTEGKEYELYAQSVVENVVRKSANGLDGVLKVYEITDGKPQTGKTYTISDGLYSTYSPIVCNVEDRDTVWTYGDMRIKHSALADDIWNVENKDEKFNHDGHKYNFTVEAKLESEPDSSHVRHPWTMTFNGTRIEKTEYSMQYKSETPINVTWDDYSSFYWSGFNMYGEFIINFVKGGSKLDWIRAIYSEAGQTYVTSM